MDAVLEQIPYGAQILAIIVAVFSLVHIVVPDEKIPAWLKPVWNLLALNVGKAANDPAKNK